MDEKKIKSPAAEREEAILHFWEENKIFEKTLSKESPKGEFVFFEGPPTMNGKPGIHHVEARVFKDALPRYKTMQGYSVPRKAGFDTHGLPVELQMEKTLGLQSKKEIEIFGVAEFNKKCKESVLELVDIWRTFTKRIGYWADLDNAYFTFQNSYIESVWSVIAKANERGLLYKDYKVVPWCPRCGTGLSSHELAQGYQDVKDLSIYAKFKIEGEEKYILAWTTTPWTLPGNVALAVGKDIDYIEAKLPDSSIVILAKERASLLPEGYDVIKETKGSDLAGLSYEPLYPFLKDNLPESEKEKLPKAFKIYEADFVTTTDGTGVVHTAVMYGTDDFDLGTKVGLPKFHTVTLEGKFISGTGFLEGRFVKDEEVAVDIIKDLAHRGLLFKKEKYEHSYPHCWRCKTPLIYYARDSWYIAMSKLRDVLVKENEGINWEPEYIKEGRFGEWLREIKDWAISRERYWGTPLPVWETEDGSERVVVDSLETLKKHVKTSGNTYFLMRHGEATHNLKEVLSSDNEEVHHLTDKGRESARNTAEKLKDKKIDLIIVSPLARTQETMEEVKKILGDIDTITDERIREEDFGGLSGTHWSKFGDYFPDFSVRMTTSVQGCETMRDIKKRVGEFLYDIESKYEGKNILVITHDGPAKAALAIAAGTDEKNFKEIYNPGVPFLTTGDYSILDFVPLPHNERHELDLHKPYIDGVELVSSKGEPLKRAKEVMDVWFDSGAMPFAQYSGEKKENPPYPADFISEAIDQTRGWFYTLHAIGSIMEKGKAYKNVICLGHLLDKNGKKMSKSLGNIVDPWEEIEKYGIDAIRMWMYSVNQPGESKNYDGKTVDEINKKVFNLVSNVLTFYELYRDLSLEGEVKPTHVLDRWILAKTDVLVKSMTASLEDYKLLEPVRAIRNFVDDLSTWYLQLSRDRFRDNDEGAKQTLYFVLKTLSKLLAPFAPFYAEDLYQKLRKDVDPESVHLESWPEASLGDSKDLFVSMEKTRDIVSIGLEARTKAGIKVRQPLSSLSLPESLEIPEEFQTLVRERVNVKEVVFRGSEDVVLTTEITESLREEGIVRELIRFVQDLRKQKGLTPNDLISLSVGSDEAGKKLLEKPEWQTMLQETVLAKEFNLGESEGETCDVEGLSFTISIS